MEKNIIISARDLTKKFVIGEVEVNALRGISFDVYEGELVVILGPSGSGKSTMLNIIGAIEKATTGKLLYKNQDISDYNKSKLTEYRRKNIGFIFQFYNLIPNLTSLENIKLVAELSDNPIDANELIKAVGLEDRANHFPSKLSGGQQQRVAIARSICKNPEVLLCDEPTGALDITTGVQILDLLCNFNKKYKKTVIIITHNAQIADVADRVFYVKDGLLDKIVVNENPKSPNEVNW